MIERTDLSVSCYAGHRGEETPRHFTLGGRTVEVVEIVDRWIAPEHRYFKCRGSDGGVYILRYDVERDAWELTMYASGAEPRAWGTPEPKTKH